MKLLLRMLVIKNIRGIDMSAWTSFEEFVEELNKQKYLVLRNYENVLEELEQGGDLDILCEDKEEIVTNLKALPRNNREVCFNYYVMVQDRKLLLDIRNVGDGYYDTKWEKEMLEKRIFNGTFFIMDEENYKYSLLYHALIHKKEIPSKYINRFCDQFMQAEMNEKWPYKLLGQFIATKKYRLVKPKDPSVKFNKKNFNKLKLAKFLNRK